jgi:hypothetical protein
MKVMLPSLFGCEYIDRLEPINDNESFSLGKMSTTRDWAVTNRSTQSSSFVDSLKQIFESVLPYNDLYIHPDIPSKKLAKAYKKCNVPTGEGIIGLVDFTVFGSASEALLFGVRGIYFHNGWDSKKPGSGFIPYTRLSSF